MVIYSCTTLKSDKKSRFLILLLYILSLAMMIYGSLAVDNGKYMRMLSLFILFATTALGLRFVLLTYVYSIEREDESIGPDLVIRSVKPKKTSVVCRVSLAGGTFMPVSSLEKEQKQGKKAYNYASGIFLNGAYCFISSEGDDCIIYFSPDLKMIKIISEIAEATK